MGGSIAHPDPDTRRETLARVFAELEGELRIAAEAAEADTAASLREFARLLTSLDRNRLAGEPATPPNRLPVGRFWDAALRSANGAPGALIAALETLGPWLSWAQNPNYRRRPPDATFLENYGYAVIAGPEDGPPAIAAEPRLALGVLLLGPHAHYPVHAHPAIEIYYTLTPGGEWWRDEGPWRRMPPRAVIHHAPHVRHATRAGSSLLLAIYLWRGDLATHARLTAPARGDTG